MSVLALAAVIILSTGCIGLAVALLIAALGDGC